MSGLRNNWEVRLCRIFCTFDFKELLTKTILLKVHDFLHNFKYDELKERDPRIFFLFSEEEKSRRGPFLL